jgi:hypothetical protein
MAFDYSLDYKILDFRERPDLYRVGVGEQGVLLVRPYRDELLPLWRFRTPEVARMSAAALLVKFHEYRLAGDFVGMDMARKFLQMGVTRSRRYANRRSGRKYADDGTLMPLDPDPVKARCAELFAEKLREALEDPTYQAQLREWRRREREQARAARKK